MTSSLLSARSLSKRYGAGIALNNVDLDIHPGESVAIMGASGSGKTTLLHVLAGITTPDSGSVNYAGTDVTALNETSRSKLRREAFGFVFQSGLLIPELTAIENVALALMLNGVSRRDAEAQSAAWLAQLGLAGMENRRIGELSGGQAQRVAIARSQVTGARIVFADEPTGALDSTTSAEVMSALLNATAGRGNTLVLVTHDPTVASRCSRTLTMADGVLSQAPSSQAGAAAVIPFGQPTVPLGTTYMQHPASPLAAHPSMGQEWMGRP
ncbi:putative ABC transport system ATP-binding protein [Arthrobacter alpinus]|uniref:Putative ABC transport system ATP-binding protein n=1 Tax=Arthrobacter alpinus TaxID=656366 RepID=A0A1H5E0X1_9MICC|nr:ABC transporter ATP-binding protein [Arthrobacter alpinus]SED84590.1 putative ABC transport system ATP-binding protein [Arthrobacter alpinus]